MFRFATMKVYINPHCSSLFLWAKRLLKLLKVNSPQVASQVKVELCVDRLYIQFHFIEAFNYIVSVLAKFVFSIVVQLFSRLIVSDEPDY